MSLVQAWNTGLVVKCKAKMLLENKRDGWF